MTSDLAVLLRPINIHAGNSDFALDGGAKSLTHGTHGCILNLLYDFDAQLGANFDVYFTADYRVKIDHNDNFAIVWSDTMLRDLLGFTGNLNGQTNYTSTYRPSYCWFPTYPTCERGRFAIDQGETFAGVITQSGRLAGISTGPDLQYRDLRWMHEPAANVFIEAADVWTGQRARSWEYFVQQARTAQVVGASDSQCKGFYFFGEREDLFFYCGDPAIYPAISKVSGSGGITVDTAYGAEPKFTFCHFAPQGADLPKLSLSVTRTRYSIDAHIHTATAPTWQV